LTGKRKCGQPRGLGCASIAPTTWWSDFQQDQALSPRRNSLRQIRSQLSRLHPACVDTLRPIIELEFAYQKAQYKVRALAVSQNTGLDLAKTAQGSFLVAVEDRASTFSWQELLALVPDQVAMIALQPLC
jgi:hypothetical protein